MHRIGNSEEPTPRQMMNMAENLRDRLNSDCVIEAKAKGYLIEGFPKMEYLLYISGDKYMEYFNSWPETIEAYRKLMKGEKL